MLKWLYTINGIGVNKLCEGKGGVEMKATGIVRRIHDLVVSYPEGNLTNPADSGGAILWRSLWIEVRGNPEEVFPSGNLGTLLRRCGFFI